jgi:hypothetical protein
MLSAVWWGRRFRLPAAAILVWIAAAPLFALQPVAIGHEYRQDDSPAITAAPDGSLWATWLSFAGDRDDIAIRRYRSGKWENLQWVPGTSGDNWQPQIAVDAADRVWVVWSQQNSGNWDLYARRFDPAAQDWGPLLRLTTDPLPDIRPRLASDGKGHFALVWQGFRGRTSSIFLKTFDGEKWSAETRLTNHSANDWDPAVAMDGSGAIWVAFDTYQAGNYDVYLRRVGGDEIPVARTPRMEARASVAVDIAGRVWVAYESGNAEWGKDEGYFVRNAYLGIWPPMKDSSVLGGTREAVVRCYHNGRWSDPAAPLAKTFTTAATYQPNVFSDGQGSIWAFVRGLIHVPPPAQGQRPAVYWDYQATHFDGKSWSAVMPLPQSGGRASVTMGATVAADGTFWAVWPTENRVGPNWHRPHQQQVLAAAFPKVSSSAEPVWKAESGDAAPPRAPGHPHEVADLAAIRRYTVTIEGKPHHIVRGDFHRHTELSWDGGGGLDGSLTDFYRYMIDCASMDFGASTDHQGGAWPYWWWYSQKLTDMYHVPGGYVPIFGYERSAFYPFGHRNVFFARRADSRVTPFFVKQGHEGYQIPAGPLGDEPGVASSDLVASDTRLLYEDVRPRGAVVIPHTPATNQGTDWADNDPKLEPVVEIFQGARASSESLGAPLAYEKDMSIVKNVGYQPAGFVTNAWAKGYKLGIIASSDHSSTHISYAMVYTADRTRQGILDAIHRRHTYGAMDNIIMDVRMGEHFMGDEFSLTAAVPLHVKVMGTEPLAAVAVIRDGKVVYSVEPKKQLAEFDYKDTGTPAGKHYYYVRVQQQNKLMAWSSPMFITYKTAGGQ